MCGIYGAIAFSGSGKLAIAHWRPRLKESAGWGGGDGWGEYLWDGGYLGVARAQPLPEGEGIELPLSLGPLHLVFNGTLSNDHELAAEYQLGDFEVDTEVAIRLWARFGWRCCEEMVGGFAFAVWNGESLTIVKNFKTLWYVKTSDYFVFASEKDFLVRPGVGEFDEEYPRRFPQNRILELTPHGLVFSYTLKRQYWSSTPDLDEGRALIVTSGGVDSITSAYVAQKVHGRQVELIHFDYAQLSAEREWEAVQRIAFHLGCPHQRVDLRQLGSWGASPLTDHSIELPLGRRSVESTLCWTPGRNMLMLAYAASYAESQGIKWLYYGNNLEEEATGYSDNDLEFIHLYNQLLDYGTLKGVKIRRALARVMKPEILCIGTALGVPYQWTWSCDQGGALPCGYCGCCTTRRHAFKRAGLKDPQTYEQSLRDQYPWKGSKIYNLDELMGLVNADISVGGD